MYGIQNISGKMNKMVSAILLIAMLITILPFNSYSYATDVNTQYDTIPIDSNGHEGDRVKAVSFDNVDVNHDTWQITGLAFSVAKVPEDTVAIKWYDSNATKYYTPPEKYKEVGTKIDNEWWSVDLNDLTECDESLGKSQYSTFLAVMGWKDAYCREASYYELYNTKKARDYKKARHFFIQVGDKNSPLNVYAEEDPAPSYSNWKATKFSNNNRINLLLGAGKRYEVFNDTDQTIWYTTDGSDPTSSATSMEYTEPIKITRTCIVKAAAKVSDEKWGKVSQFECVINCQAPVISPESGSYRDSVEATLTSATDGAEIYYTLDGQNPVDENGDLSTSPSVQKYESPLEISTDTVIKAAAVKNGAVSEIESSEFRFSTFIDVAIDGNDQGVWLREKSISSDRADEERTIITPYGRSECRVIVTAKDGASLKLNDKVINPDENGRYVLELKSKLNSKLTDNGQENIITVTNEGKYNIYRIYCLASLFDDLPDRIVDYFVPASQYTNSGGTIGCAPNRTLIGKCGDVFHCSSLGNYGGYIVWKYEDGIKNDPKNPYGVDFIVFGNSFDGTNEAAEPGNILVSENGTDWYTLAGSIHYDDNAVWNQIVKYQNNNGLSDYSFEGLNENVPAGSFKMPSGSTEFQYPGKFYYSLHEGDEDSFETTGTFLKPDGDKNEYGNVRPPYPAFGYADTGSMIDGSNVSENPYNGLIRDVSYPDRVRTNRNGDACDISWAVDQNGAPVKLDEIHYVKVQTASFINNGAIGEKSTEVCCMRIAKADDSAVGVTDAPKSIKIDGTEVALTEGEVVNAAVDGVFDIAVDAPGATVYINSLRSHTAFMKEAPHKIVRIIVQEGRKEPRIYYYNVGDQTGSGSEVTFDAGKGLVQDKEKLTYYYDQATLTNFNGKAPIPEAEAAKESQGFAYWYDDSGEEVKRYYSLTEANAEELNGKTLIAKYEKAADVDAAKEVEALIEALPEVDKLAGSDAAAIVAARKAYNALEDAPKDLVNPELVTKLTAAEAAITDVVEAMINALPATENMELTEEVEKQIADAADAYKALSDDLKKEVSNYPKLLETQFKLVELKLDAADKLLEQTISEKDGKISELEGKITDLETELSNTKAELKTAKEVDIPALNKKISDLETELGNTRDELEKVQKESAEKDDTIEALSEEVSDLTAKLNDAVAKLEKATDEEIPALNAEIAGLEKKLEQANADLEKARKALADESWNDIIAAARETLEEAKADLAAASDSVTTKTLKALVKTAEKAIDAAAAKAEEASKALSENAKEILKLREQVAQTTSDLAKASEELAKAVTDGAASEAEITELRIRVSLAEAAKAAAEKEVADLKSKLAETKAAKAAAEAEAAEAKADKAKAEAEAAELRQKLAAAEADKDAAEKAAAAAEAARAEFEKAAAEAEAARAAAEAARGTAENDLTETKEALKKAQDEIDKLKEKVASLTEKNEALKAEKAAKALKVKGLKVTVKDRKFTVKWTKNDSADGYKVQYRLKGKKKYKTLKNLTDTKVVTRKFKTGKTYQFRVRTYKTVSGKKVYGKWTKAKTKKCK